jgi:hypothetical protein
MISHEIERATRYIHSQDADETRTIACSRISTRTKTTQKMRATTERKQPSSPTVPPDFLQERRRRSFICDAIRNKRTCCDFLQEISISAGEGPSPIWSLSHLRSPRPSRSSQVCASPPPTQRLPVCPLPDHRILQQRLTLVE